MTIKSRIAVRLVPLAAVVLLQGCIAALPIVAAGVYAVSAGYVVFKSVQTASGSQVKIAFNEEEERVDKAALLQVTKPGVWPDNEAEVAIASTLESSGEFSAVITPATVSQELTKQSRTQSMALLTETERLQIMREVCDAIGADALIATRDLGTEANANTFSFSRANITSYTEVIIYAREADRIVFNTEMEVVIEVGSSAPNQQEGLEAIGEAIAEKIVSLRI